MQLRQKEGGFLFLRIPGSRKIRKLLGIAAFLVLAGTGGKYYGVTDCLSGLLGLRGSAAVAPAPHVRPGTGRQGRLRCAPGQARPPPDSKRRVPGRAPGLKSLRTSRLTISSGSSGMIRGMAEHREPRAGAAPESSFARHA